MRHKWCVIDDPCLRLAEVVRRVQSVGHTRAEREMMTDRQIISDVGCRYADVIDAQAAIAANEARRSRNDRA